MQLAQLSRTFFNETKTLRDTWALVSSKFTSYNSKVEKHENACFFKINANLHNMNILY